VLAVLRKKRETLINTPRPLNILLILRISLKKAQEDAASLTPEYVAANMSTEEAKRLSRVRNIGIAVWS
jgi:hypothetical protein